MSEAADLPGSVRDAFDVVRHGTWMIGGVVNPVPEPIAQRLHEQMQEWFVWGAPHVLDAEREEHRRSHMIQSLAAAAGARATDMALVRGVGEGYQTILRGIDWRAGDRVLLTDDEEAALLLPTLHLAATEGVEVDLVGPGDDGVYRAEDFAERLTPRTRLVAFSEVTTEFGSRVPAAQVAEAARDAGALSYVDLAHSAGLGVTDLEATGCDAGGLLSYKWYYGPYGLGLLHLTSRGREQVKLRYAGGRAHQRLEFPAGPFELRPGAQSFQYGPWFWATVAGWVWSVEYLDDLGWDVIAEHTASRASHLKRELDATPDVEVETPMAPEHSAALVSFSVGGWGSEPLRDALWERASVRVKARENSVGVRAGISLFTTDEDLDRLIEGVRSLARAPAKRAPTSSGDDE